MPPNPNFIGRTESNCSSQSWNVQSIIEMRRWIGRPGPRSHCRQGKEEIEDKKSKASWSCVYVRLVLFSNACNAQALLMQQAIGNVLVSWTSTCNNKAYKVACNMLPSCPAFDHTILLLGCDTCWGCVRLRSWTRRKTSLCVLWYLNLVTY
jgi:hypothetical protein